MECPDYDPVFRLSTTTGCFLGSFPVGLRLVYAFLLANCAEVPALSRDERLARLKELAAQFHGNVSPLIQQQQDAARVVFVPVQEVQTPSYYEGRMLLIGDAAHAFSPLLAQAPRWLSKTLSPWPSCSANPVTSTRRCGPTNPGDGREWKPSVPQSAAAR